MQIASLIREEISDIHIEVDEERLRPDASEVYRLIADISKAEKLFRWKPEFSKIEGFKKGIKKTVDWFLDQDNRMFYSKEHTYVK